MQDLNLKFEVYTEKIPYFLTQWSMGYSRKIPNDGTLLNIVVFSLFLMFDPGQLYKPKRNTPKNN